MIGTTLSHFRLTAKLGEGGMGEVYAAEDTQLDRRVAIKVLPEAVASDPERLARFEREAKVLASLNHPNIVGISSLESAASVHFLVMELAAVEPPQPEPLIVIAGLSTDIEGPGARRHPRAGGSRQR